MSKTYIIDPSSTEWNRGSFCYLPYLLFDSLKWETEEDVEFIENFTVLDLPKIKADSEILVAFWSPTQKNLCLELYRNFPNAKFFGYYGFVKEYGLPVRVVTPHEIATGMRHQGKSFGLLKTTLLSDCDSHIQGEFKGDWYPLHTSYGCPNGCSFCPSSKNNEGKWNTLPLYEVYSKLRFYKEKGYTNIHFTDEDLFLHTERSYKILEYCKELGGFNIIALTHSQSMIRFTDEYDVSFLREAGVRLLEVGFEGTNLLSEKGNNHLEHCIELHKRCGDLVYWLTMTFGPGETINTIKETGIFLKQYGKKPEELLPRLRTNGTECGLGQFYQPYPDMLPKMGGIKSPFDYVRLFPSYIPRSFTEDRITSIAPHKRDELTYWASLYNVEKYIAILTPNARGRYIDELLENDTYIVQAEKCIFLAIAARLGVIKGV